MTEVRQRNVALILARELAVNLATPMWIWDETGTLVYLNEQAQSLLGMSPNESLTSRVEELPQQFRSEDLDGNPIEWSDLPSAVALHERRPAHRTLRFTGFDGLKREIGVTAFPLFARGDEFVGAMAVFWQIKDEA